MFYLWVAGSKSSKSRSFWFRGVVFGCTDTYGNYSALWALNASTKREREWEGEQTLWPATSESQSNVTQVEIARDSMPIYKAYIHSIKIKSKANLPDASLSPFPCPCVQKQLSNINDNLYRNWNRNAVNKCRFALSLETLQVRESDDAGGRDEWGRWCSALGCHTARETQQQGTPFFSKAEPVEAVATRHRCQARRDQSRPGQAVPASCGPGRKRRQPLFSFSVFSV